MIGTVETGGEGGIRTLGTGFSPYNGLANRRIRPLCHLSGFYKEQFTIRSPKIRCMIAYHKHAWRAEWGDTNGDTSLSNTAHFTFDITRQTSSTASRNAGRAPSPA